MLRHTPYFTLITMVMLFYPILALADVNTPASNLAGIRQVQDRIDVSLSLKGAAEFDVEASEITKIIRSAFSQTRINMAVGDFSTPSVHVAISGENTGDGGAEFIVEIVIRAIIPSPFTKERSIVAIIWRNSVTGSQHKSYDPISKSLLSPSGAIKDRVYDSVREVATHLILDAKIANSEE